MALPRRGVVRGGFWNFLVVLLVLSLLVNFLTAYLLSGLFPLRRAVPYLFNNPARPTDVVQLERTLGAENLTPEDLRDASVAADLIQLLESCSKNRSPRTRGPSPGFTLLQELPSIPGSKAAVIGWVLLDSSNRVWVIFRGTISAEEFRQDLHFSFGAPGKDAPYSVHPGFMEIFGSFRPVLVRALEENGCGGKEVIVAGHSLGSALAVLVLNFLGGPNGWRGFGFGTPRVGDPRFTRHFNSLPRVNFTNFLNLEDVFTNAPLSVMPNELVPAEPFLYSHCGELVVFSRNLGSFVRNHSITTYAQLVRGHLSLS